MKVYLASLGKSCRVDDPFYVHTRPYSPSFVVLNMLICNYLCTCLQQASVTVFLQDLFFSGTLPSPSKAINYMAPPPSPERKHKV